MTTFWNATVLLLIDAHMRSAWLNATAFSELYSVNAKSRYLELTDCNCGDLDMVTLALEKGYISLWVAYYVEIKVYWFHLFVQKVIQGI